MKKRTTNEIVILKLFFERMKYMFNATAEIWPSHKTAQSGINVVVVARPKPACNGNVYAVLVVIACARVAL